MLSGNDIVQARDNAALKARGISSTWGIMFSGNGELFIPFADQVRYAMRELGDGCDLVDIINLLEHRYRCMREKQFVDWHICKFGYETLEQFRLNGLKELGNDIFSNIIAELNRLDLGI
jgi:hypothetical protein